MSTPDWHELIFCVRAYSKQENWYALLVLYIDDTVVLTETAKRCAKWIEEYFRLWQLKINASKNKIVLFSCEKFLIETFEEAKLDVDKYVYLRKMLNYNKITSDKKVGIRHQLTEARYC